MIDVPLRKNKQVFASSVEETMGVLQKLGAFKNTTTGFTYIKTVSLRSISQVCDVQDELRRGNILILDTLEILSQGETAILEFKRALEQIKGTVRELGGSLGRLGEQYIIATPNPHLKINA